MPTPHPPTAKATTRMNAPAGVLRAALLALVLVSAATGSPAVAENGSDNIPADCNRLQAEEGCAGGGDEPRIDSFRGRLKSVSCTGTYEKVPTSSGAVLGHALRAPEPTGTQVCPCLLIVALMLLTVIVTAVDTYLSLQDDPDHTYSQVLECASDDWSVWATGSGGFLRTVTIYDQDGIARDSCDYKLPPDNECQATVNDALGTLKYTKTYSDDIVPQKVDVCIQPDLTVRNEAALPGLGLVFPAASARFSDFNPQGICKHGVEVEWTESSALGLSPPGGA